MIAMRVIAGILGIGSLALAVPGLVIDLHDSWMENTFHIFAFGGVGAYAIYFGLTGRYRPGARKERSEVT